MYSKVLNKKTLLIIMISLLLIPTVVFASDGDNESFILNALFSEAFITILMAILVLKPLSFIISKENSKKIFWILFTIRIVILLIFDFIAAPIIQSIDLMLFFVGAFFVMPILSARAKTNINSNKVIRTPSDTSSSTSSEQVNGIELKCAKCNNVVQITDKFCTKCGAAIEGDNVVVSEKKDASVILPPKEIVLPSNFDSMYSLPENEMLAEFINRELIKANIDKSSKLIPSDILKRKKILNIIFSILVFVFITLIFFHFPIYTYIIGIVILFIFYRLVRKYNLIKYLQKQLKSRPSEKISNIIMNVKTTFVKDNSKTTFIICLLVAAILPLIIFSSPRILYEKVDGGYAVRYYIFGVTNFRKVTIPETYKNEKIVSLRGNTFSNMPLLESVSLPDTITEIRGQAFKNCKRLTNVNIPKNLEYLGGGAFYNAKSLKSIVLPNTLTYLGGESFYGAKSLEYVKLSDNLTEIRGDSFEYCTSLQSIIIPDNITRIGGHAFYGASSLSKVSIGENSKLNEIGSSAFRQCSSLYSITIPYKTSVNERAFKESPTTVNRFSYDFNNETEGNSSSKTTKQDTYESLLESSIHTSESEYLSNNDNYVAFDKFNVIVNARMSNVGENVLEVRSSDGFSWRVIKDFDYIVLNKCKVEIEKRGSMQYLIKVKGVDELSKIFQNNKVINLNLNDTYKIKDNLSLTLSNIMNMNETVYYEFDVSENSNHIVLTKKEGLYILDNNIMLEIVSSGEKQVSVKVYYN